jgi:DMSO/TMAO reductase YedYZ molybdopterin-dependent catalytic subunit
LLATAQGGAALELLHGGPLRLVAPAKYGRKSVKWLRAIEVLAEDRPGFWERRGLSANADPWRAERGA